MNIHKKTKLTPHAREEIWRFYHKDHVKVTRLVERFRVSRPAIYKALKLAHQKLF